MYHQNIDWHNCSSYVVSRLERQLAAAKKYSRHRGTMWRLSAKSACRDMRINNDFTVLMVASDK